MNYKSLKEKLSPKLAKALEDLKAELVDIGFTRHKGEMTVSVYIYKTDDDFRRNMDMKLDAKLKNNEKYMGILKNYDEESFTLDCDGETIDIKRADVKKLTQAIEF